MLKRNKRVMRVQQVAYVWCVFVETLFLNPQTNGLSYEHDFISWMEHWNFINCIKILPLFYVLWQNVSVNKHFCTVPYLSTLLDSAYTSRWSPGLGNPLHSGVKMVAYFGNFCCLPSPKNSRSREQVCIRVSERERFGAERTLLGAFFG